VLGRIQILAEGGLTSIMVVHGYVSKCIAPLQERTRLAWLYNGVNDVTRLEHSDGSVLDEKALALVMGKLSSDPSSHDFITPPASCQPLYMDQAARTLLVVVMPSMDDIGIAPVQRGDQSPMAYGSLGQASRVARVVLSPLRPPARTKGRWCESSTAMMRYHMTMMSRCKGE
jgi:hypothetical protein